MRKHNLKAWLTGLIALSLLVACQSSPTLTSTQSDTSTTTVTTEATAVAVTVSEALADNSATHDNPDDYMWDESESVPITLNGDSIAADDNGVTVDGSTATITAAGTYTLTGSLADGQIVVDTEDDDLVRLVLAGVNLSSSTSAPINVVKAEQVMIVLADGTENTLSDALTYVYADPEDDEPNAALFSSANLTISGTGSLTVNGNYNDGIVSKDGLIIASGNLTVNAVDDGIRGKDYLVVKDGSLTVTSGGDGLKSDNDEDATLGYIAIEAGSFNVAAGGDAIAAQTDVTIADGLFTLASGGGSSAQIADTESAKGIKGLVAVSIDGGTFTIDSADDALHSNGSLVINGGTFSIASGDDGAHADVAVEINAGDITITKSYEGLESAALTLNGGNINIVASDDGINGAGGNDASGFAAGSGLGGGPGQGGGQFGGPGQDAFVASGGYSLDINGGIIIVNADGDGIDIGGNITMTDGLVIVNGPTEQMNGPLDYDGTFEISGGTLIAVGSSGMAMAPSASSSQNSLLLNFTSTQSAGTLIHIQNAAGEDLLTFTPAKAYQSMAFSSPQLEQGTAYTVYVGGSSTGTVTSGLYQGGLYTPGTEYTTFTPSSTVTQIGSNRR